MEKTYKTDSYWRILQNNTDIAVEGEDEAGLV